MALRDYLVQEVALDCEDGLLSRREALRRLGLLGVTGAAAVALLAACGDDDDAASTTAAVTTPTTAASTTTASTPAGSEQATSPPSSASASSTGEEIRFSGPNGELIGVLAEADSPQGAVLVIHENRGLTPHIRSIPPRLAADGYTALAIDLLSAEGGTASLPSEGDATAALGNAPAERLIADVRAGLDELGRRAPDAKLAAIGFCFGGGMTWQLLAAGEPRLAAAVPFYGPVPGRRRPVRLTRTPRCSASTPVRTAGSTGPWRRRAGAHRRRPHARVADVRGRRPRLLQRHGRPLRRRSSDTGLPGDARLVRPAPAELSPYATWLVVALICQRSPPQLSSAPVCLPL